MISKLLISILCLLLSLIDAFCSEKIQVVFGFESTAGNSIISATYTIFSGSNLNNLFERANWYPDP